MAKPEPLKAQWEPVILSSIEQTLASRGFTKAPIGTADLKVYYYVLIGAGTTAQTMGQFLPAVPQWGIPPFDAGTSALEVYPQGTLIVDLSSPAAQTMVWRGSAQTRNRLSGKRLDSRKADSRVGPGNVQEVSAEVAAVDSIDGSY